MPDWLIACLVPIGAALFAWVLKRVVASVIDERVTPKIDGLRDELRAHMNDETGINDRIVEAMADIRERVAHLEGARR